MTCVAAGIDEHQITTVARILNARLDILITRNIILWRPSIL
jgi:hypothetical protein